MTDKTKKTILNSCVSFGIGAIGGSIYELIKIAVLKHKVRKTEEERIRLEKEAEAKLRKIQALEEATKKNRGWRS